MPKKDKLPLSQALLWIVLSVVIVTGSAVLLLVYFHYRDIRRETNPAYNVTKLVQTGPQKQALKTICLAELLDLSADKPVNLYALSTNQYETKLLRYPFIESCHITKQFPDTIVVDYKVRTPFALLADFHNVAIDKQLYPFPIFPFFTPKKLPKIFLGLKEEKYELTTLYQKQLQNEKLVIASELLMVLSQPQYHSLFEVVLIDVSKFSAVSLGQKEIVVVLKNFSKDGTAKQDHILRLNVNNYLKNLGDYLTLREDLMASDEDVSIDKNSPIIDFRLSDIAYITP